MGVTRHDYLYNLDLQDTYFLLRAYNRQKVDRLEAIRITLLPHLDGKKTLTEVMPLPNDTEYTEKEAVTEEVIKEIREINENYI